MSADELIQYLSWAVYVAIFVVVATRAIRKPLRANVDIALFFTISTAIIALGILGPAHLRLFQSSPILTFITTGLLLAIPYMLLRLVDDFSEVSLWLVRASVIGLAALLVGAFVLAYQPASPISAVLVLVMLVYLVGLLLYTGVAFAREAGHSSGVTRRRMHAVAIGALCLCSNFFILGLGRSFPEGAGLWQSLSALAGLASGVSFFLGFAPPRLVRRAWQEPELRAFLGRAANLPRLPTTEAIIEEMEHGAAGSVGAPNASIGLWDEEAKTLNFIRNGQPFVTPVTNETTTGRSFLSQKPIFTADVGHDNPATARVSQAHGAKSVLAAPITAGRKRLGMLVVYSPRTPIFADEDLELVQLLADQAAVILESRALLDEATRVRAREEVTRLKDDFLSAAAHDLKTPLTTLVGLTQLLQRRAERTPDAPTDLNSLKKLGNEAQRLRTLVLELLDAAQAERGRLVGEREQVDLLALAQETCERHNSERHPCVIRSEGPGREPVVGFYDASRIGQLLENLMENAVKYSPEGGEIMVSLGRVVDSDGEWNCLSVADKGIGIPSSDLPHLFERFHRGKNVNDRRFAGMGLGLYICWGIVEQHGGRIRVESSPGVGSTFYITLPATDGSIVSGVGEKEREIVGVLENG